MGRPTYQIKKQPSSLSEDKAWLLGHLAGDGGFVLRDRRTEVTIYAGLDKDIAEECVRLFRDVYGANSRISTRSPGKGKRKHVAFEVTCSWKEVVHDLLTYSTFGIKRWRVPSAVLEGPDTIKTSWVSGFADAEGHVAFDPSVSRRTVTITSTNKTGLTQVSTLLKGLGIRHGWHSRKPATGKKGRWSVSHCVFITYHDDLAVFSRKIGFRSHKKQTTLQNALSSYQRKPRRTEDIERHREEIITRRRAGETHSVIALSLGLQREVVAGVCYRNGVEPEGREGNAAGGKRSIGRSSRYVHEEKLPLVLRYKEEGISLREIAQRLGFKNEHRVQDLLQRAARKGLIKRFPRRKGP